MAPQKRPSRSGRVAAIGSAMGAVLASACGVEYLLHAKLKVILTGLGFMIAFAELAIRRERLFAAEHHEPNDERPRPRASDGAFVPADKQVKRLRVTLAKVTAALVHAREDRARFRDELTAAALSANVIGSADEDRDVSRLRAKLAELKAILADAREERVSLRHELASVKSRGGGAAQSSAQETATAAEEASEEDSGAPVPGAPRRSVLIPAFSAHACRAMQVLPARVERQVLFEVTALAAGEERPWRDTKQLVHPTVVYSTRVGIHYRALFVLDGATLSVVDVIHRKDLNVAIARLG